MRPFYERLNWKRLDRWMQPLYTRFSHGLSRFAAPIFVLPAPDAPLAQIAAYGTLTFIDTGQVKVWVTCSHVLTGMMEEAQKSADSIACVFLGPDHPVIYLDKIPVIDQSDRIDLAVLAVPFELSPQSDRIFYKVPRWPIPRATIGESVTVIGCPRSDLEIQPTGGATIGYSWFGFSVSSVSDRHFVMANERGDRSYIVAPPDTDTSKPLLLPGMSGGPAFANRGPNRVELVGFIYEGRDSDSSIFLTHANFLCPDGTLDHHAIPP
jgi:hypothetical protein